MQKNILSISLILLTLNTTGCVQRTIQTTEQSIPVVQNRPLPPVEVHTRPIFENIPTTQQIPSQREISSYPQEPIAPTIQPSIQPTVTTHSTTHATGGETRQFRTVQGTSIAIQKRSNGFSFPQYQDKIIILQVFGKHCEYCFKEIPIIKRIQRKYAHNSKIIALQAQAPMSRGESSSLIQRFQMNYPIIDKSEAASLLLNIQNNYEWTGVLPCTLIIKNGVTEQAFKGEVSYQELDELMSSL